MTHNNLVESSSHDRVALAILRLPQPIARIPPNPSVH